MNAREGGAELVRACWRGARCVVVRMAEENPTWRYTRMVASLKNAQRWRTWRARRRRPRVDSV